MVLSHGFIFQASGFILWFYLKVLCFRLVVLSHGFMFQTCGFISWFYFSGQRFYVSGQWFYLMGLYFRPVVLYYGLMFQASGFILWFYLMVLSFILLTLSHVFMLQAVFVLMVLCYKPVVLSNGFMFQAGGFSVQHSGCPWPRAEQGTGRRDLQRNHPLLERFFPPGERVPQSTYQCFRE